MGAQIIDALILFVAVHYYLFNYDYHGSSGLAVLNLDGNIIKQIVIALTMIYLVISIVKIKQSSSLIYKTKFGLLILIISLTTFLSTFNLMYLRAQNEPHEYIHDHPLQIEEGLKFLVAGENPYTNNYHATPMSKWAGWTANPALYHYISLPSSLYIPLPLFLLSEQLFDWFDYRIVNLIFLVIASISAYILLDNKKYKIIAIISLCLNPFFTPYFITGMEDVIFLGAILLSLVLLKKQKVLFSLIVMAIAITNKQMAWFIIPFYFYYLYQQGFLKNKVMKKIAFFVIPVLVIVVPFVLWDAQSFIEDIYYYPAGNLPTSYPIGGVGISPLLVERGIIPNNHSYFPFWKIQVIILSPLLFWLFKSQKKNPILGQVMLNYGMLLGVFWYFSRFFNESYVGVLTVIFSIGGLLWLENKNTNISTFTK